MSPSVPESMMALTSRTARLYLKVADHQSPVELLGAQTHLLRLGRRRGEWLFHEDVLARIKRLEHRGRVRSDRGGDDHGAYHRIGERYRRVSGHLGHRRHAAGSLQGGGVEI